MNDERRRYERTMIIALVLVIVLGAGAYALRPEPRRETHRIVDEGFAVAQPAPMPVPMPVIPGQAVPFTAVTPPVAAVEPQAQELILAAFTRAFGVGSTRAEKLGVIIDGSSIEHLFDEFARAYPGAASTTEVEVHAIEFVSPDAASVRFELYVSGAPAGGMRTGRAERTVDGWKVTRDTACVALAVDGSVCPADAIE